MSSGRRLGALLLLAAVSGCEEHDRDRWWGRPDPRLEGRWAIVSLNGAPVVSVEGPEVVTVGRGVISWNLCNADRRPYRVRGVTLHLRPGDSTTTLMGCPDSRDREMEIALRPGSHAFTLSGDQLSIDDGTLILRRTAEDACPPRRYGESLKRCP